MPEMDLMADDATMPEVGIQDPMVGENLLLDWIRREINMAQSHVDRFRKEYTRARRFYDGKHLTKEDLQQLRDDARPDNVFNSAQKFVRFITGIERVAPEALIFSPIDENDQTQQALGEFTTRSYDWAIAKASGDYERSIAFEDLIIGGMGWEDYSIEFGRDPRGLPAAARFSPLEALFPQTDRQNLENARWRAREMYIDKDEALARWPDDKFVINMALRTGDAQNRPEASDTIVYTVPYTRTEPISESQNSDPKQNKLQVLQFEWYDNEPGYYFYDPLERNDTWMNEKDFFVYRRKLRSYLDNDITDYVKRSSKQYKRIFLLNRRHQLGEVIKLKRFHLNCMTGSYEAEEKIWIGYFRLLIDPSRFANKFFNQLLEIVGRSAKGGGFLYEKGSFSPNQITDFINNYAKPGTSHETNVGAITGRKIMPKPEGQLPTATMGLLQFSVQAMQDITGISPEQYGAGQSANVPNVTLRQKSKSSLLLLAKEFDALSRYRIEEGHIILDLLETLSDDRLIRIGGHADGQVVKLIHEPFMAEYDLSLDETERDPNIRKMYEENVIQLAPTLIRMQLFLPELLDYMRLPFRFKKALKDAIMRESQQRQQAAAAGIPQGGRSSPVTPQERAANIQKTQAETAVQMARAERLKTQSKRDEVRTIMEALVKSMELTLDKEKHGSEQAQRALDLFQQAINPGAAQPNERQAS